MIQLDTRVKGRVEPQALDGGALLDDSKQRWLHSWPGVYWHAVFNGPEVTLSFNDSADQYRLFIDNTEVKTFSKPGQQDYRISGLSDRQHSILLEKFSENQGAPAYFNGFFVAAGKGETAPHSSPNDRQIEFIGDSYTVGYGNTAGKRQCTKDEIWATTDTSKAFGPLTAEHYRADYQINAFSGRGVIRNYDGFPGDTLPELYPYALYDGKSTYDAPDWNWNPQVIVIALGTNDFSTPVHAGEKWKTQDDLINDYEATYVSFVKSLRAKNPNAAILLISYDPATSLAISTVRDRLKADGDTRIDFLEITGFTKNACDYHPDTDDDRKISGSLITYFDAHPGIWQDQ